MLRHTSMTQHDERNL